MVASSVADTQRENADSPVPAKRDSEKLMEERGRGDLSREGSQEHLEREVPSNTTTTTTSSSSSNNNGGGGGATGGTNPSDGGTSGKKSEALEEMFQKQLETMGNLSRNKQDTIQKSESKPNKLSLNELKLKSQAEQMKNKNVGKSGASTGTEGASPYHSSSGSNNNTNSNNTQQQQQQSTVKRKQTPGSQVSEQMFNQSLSALNLVHILYSHEMKERRAKAKHFTPQHDHATSQVLPPGYTPYNTISGSGGGGGDQYSTYSTYSSAATPTLHLQSSAADQDLNATGVNAVEINSMTNSFDTHQQPVLSHSVNTRTNTDATSASNSHSNNDLGSEVTSQSGGVTSLGSLANT